ncbi:polymer-forming cytoskeletal protein [Bacteriovorax sp. Seq25_V]|uniref:bactofilin family protein n=1 Tax=Bacteriovorax sp. Seq25_V TaxID=1201288 RepID=UPI00038A2052|nr:polymer-forming cytoskeletal protein [Bacteriovorax sp. Seq25_V]EQC46087.1 polymer-forming cytoskeletal family protein [Bacteriovorax sp. Seq25_V]
MNINEQTFCFLGKDSVIRGELILSGEVHLSSTVEGDLTLKTNHTLSIEPHGKVIGTVTGINIDIYGTVTGDINASGTLRIFPSAKVEGKISAKALIIRPGAVVNMTGHTVITE